MTTSSNTNSTATTSSLIEDLTQPTIQVVVALLILAVLRFVLTRIPGTDIVALDPDITVAVLVWTVLTLAMMGTILNYVVSVGSALSHNIGKDLALAQITHLLGALLVLVWAYASFSWVPYFRTNPQQYDILFLAFGLLCGGVLTLLLYKNVGNISQLLANELNSTANPSDYSEDNLEQGPQTTEEITEMEASTRDEQSKR